MNLTLETILAMMRQAPKPLVIHCRSGADRSGLIAALYLFTIEGKRAETAAQQLSLFYGHFPYLWSRSGAMDHSFWLYAGRSVLPVGFIASRTIASRLHNRYDSMPHSVAYTGERVWRPYVTLHWRQRRYMLSDRCPVGAGARWQHWC